MNEQVEKMTSETGVTLVELLAAIGILSIVVTSFLGFFIQAAKTNQYTSNINETTFLAQEQMEEIIHSVPQEEITSVKTKNDYQINSIISFSDNSEMLKVTVTVKDKEGGKTLATMQNWLPVEAKK